MIFAREGQSPEKGGTGRRGLAARVKPCSLAIVDEKAQKTLRKSAKNDEKRAKFFKKRLKRRAF
jgi:hypothetical protein